MRIIEGFKLRTVVGQHIIVGEGCAQVNFSKITKLNESAAMLWQAVEGKDFDNETLANLLVERYGIDRSTAMADAADIAKKWIEHGLVEI